MQINKGQTANETVTNREALYGSFLGRAQPAQVMMKALYSHPKWEAMPADAKHALTMIVEKICRVVEGDPNYDDNWHDIGGYAKLVEDRIKKDKNPFAVKSSLLKGIDDLKLQSSEHASAPFQVLFLATDPFASLAPSLEAAMALADKQDAARKAARQDRVRKEREAIEQKRREAEAKRFGGVKAGLPFELEAGDMNAQRAPNHGKRWAVVNVDKLSSSFKRGISVFELAKHYSRSAGSILYKLGQHDQLRYSQHSQAWVKEDGSVYCTNKQAAAINEVLYGVIPA